MGLLAGFSSPSSKTPLKVGRVTSSGCVAPSTTLRDENQIKEAFINEGRGRSPSHLKFILLVFSKLKEDIK